VHDTEIQVLEALYKDPPIITSVLVNKSTSYLNSLEASLCNAASKPSRSILRIHLAFLVTHFCPAADGPTRYDVFLRIFFPFLLFSKPRQRTAEAVWDIIAAPKEPNHPPSFDLLTGCAEIWRAEKAKENAMDSDTMNRLNVALASRVAGEWLLIPDVRRSETAF